MKIKEIIKATKGKIISGSKKDKEVGKICIDSRLIEQNDIFLAIKGKKQDGNNYIKEIINKAGVIITQKRIKTKNETPIIKVKNVKKALKKIGIYNRSKYIDTPLIAITGSVGKTTTKELISEIFKTKYNILKTQENYNNDIGVPIMLSQINKDHDIIILELGMNHLKEIEKLSKMCKPNTAIITNIGTSHIGNLKTQENIFKAKMEITKYLKKGNLIINGSDHYLKKIKENKKYSIIKTQEEIINNITIDEKLNFDITLDDKMQKIKFNIPNKYLIENILIALETAKLYQIPTNNIIKAINKFKSPNKRLNIIKLNNNITIIDDCYNASLESIKSSLSILENFKTNKLAIIGDVLELGKHTEKIHKKIEEELKKIKNLKTITVGINTKIIKTGIHFENNINLIEYLENKNLNNITILIKASRNMHLEEIKDKLIEKYKKNNKNTFLVKKKKLRYNV